MSWQVQFSSDHALVLLNKCQANLRILQSLHQSRRKLCHAVVSAQDPVERPMQRRSCALSPYELYLLQRQEKLQQHYNSLQQAAAVMAVCKEAQGHANTFFQWLADVCHHQGQVRNTCLRRLASAVTACGKHNSGPSVVHAQRPFTIRCCNITVAWQATLPSGTAECSATMSHTDIYWLLLKTSNSWSP